MKQKKDNKKGKLLLAVFITFIMTTSILGFISSNPEESANYEGHKFTKTDQGWISYVNDQKIIVTYNPKELESINIEKSDLQDINSAKKIYVSSNPAENLQQVLSYFQAKIAPILKPSIVYSCTENIPQCSNLPLKTCNDATEDTKVITLKRDPQIKIDYSNNCLKIEGKQEDLIKIVDKLLLTLRI